MSYHDPNTSQDVENRFAFHPATTARSAATTRRSVTDARNSVTNSTGISHQAARSRSC